MATQTIADRLEEIRKVLGFKELSEFHAALGFDREEHRGYGSYAASRIYHAGQDREGRERDAPVGYLVRIAERFDVQLAWLATGKGYRTRKEQQEAEQQLDETFAAALGKTLKQVGHEAAGFPITQRFEQSLKGLAYALAHARGEDPIPSPRAWQEVTDAVFAPIVQLGLTHRPRRKLLDELTLIADALTNLAHTEEAPRG